MYTASVWYRKPGASPDEPFTEWWDTYSTLVGARLQAGRRLKQQYAQCASVVDEADGKEVWYKEPGEREEQREKEEAAPMQRVLCVEPGLNFTRRDEGNFNRLQAQEWEDWTKMCQDTVRWAEHRRRHEQSLG